MEKINLPLCIYILYTAFLLYGKIVEWQCLHSIGPLAGLYQGGFPNCHFARKPLKQIKYTQSQIMIYPWRRRNVANENREMKTAAWARKSLGQCLPPSLACTGLPDLWCNWSCTCYKHECMTGKARPCCSRWTLNCKLLGLVTMWRVHNRLTGCQLRDFEPAWSGECMLATQRGSDRPCHSWAPSTSQTQPTSSLATSVEFLLYVYYR